MTPKNIAVFADGTGQSAKSRYKTNVFKLFQLVEKAKGGQRVFYDPGVGLGWDIKGAALGRGLSENVRQCYREICRHYETGDRIYLFGFSRGAATIMSLANFLALFGCLDVDDDHKKIISEAWKIYKSPHKKRRAKIFRRLHQTKDCRIKCIGVWDIVPSLPKNQSFHDFGLNKKIDHAYHALALDEYDPMFHPAIWRMPNTRKNVLNKTIKQVWFAGVHSNIGGGYRDCALSDITLDWMIKNIRMHGFKIARRERSQASAIGCLYGCRSDETRRPRLRWPSKLGKPVLHKSVLKRRDHFKGLKETQDIRYYNPLWLARGDYRVEV